MTGHSGRFPNIRHLASDELSEGRGHLGQDLRLRILSILVLGPVALVLLYLGSWPFALLVGVSGVIMLWELFKLIEVREWRLTSIASGCVLALAVFFMLEGATGPALFSVAGGAVLSAILAAGNVQSRLWAFAGYLYVGLPCLALIVLRDEQVAGFLTVLWLFLAVWSMDIGAYIVGRTVGGPKLWPAVSPNKTWSGLIGGIFLAAVMGLGFGVISKTGGLLMLSALAAIVAIWSQFGDLAESALKRKFGAKDTSPLIPGHGGLLDRLDSTLFATLAVWLIVVVKRGPVIPWS